MSQLTSIANLRNSTAMQSRVDSVERFLKARNPRWQTNWFFPIAIIVVPNGQDDCSWVRSHTGTHHKGEGTLYQNGHQTEAEKVIANLKGYSASVADWEDKLNVLLTSAFGSPIVWSDGFGEGVAAAPTPFGKVPVSDSAPSKSSAAASALESKPVMQDNGAPMGRVARVKKSVTPTKLTKLDEAKKLFSDLTPKQKLELMAFAQEKVASSKACQALVSQGVSA